jgi:hypothetical protein
MEIANTAIRVLDQIESTGVPYMLVGAIAAGAHGIPRSTRDVDFLVPVTSGGGVNAIIKALQDIVLFEDQAVFDTLTWGKRHVGRTISPPPVKIELFELFDDPFVIQEFERRQEIFIPILKRKGWVPRAEDVIVQKLRWGREKDLADVTDILAVQGTDTLDMPYIQNWCNLHKTTERLESALARIPPL